MIPQQSENSIFFTNEEDRSKKEIFILEFNCVHSKLSKIKLKNSMGKPQIELKNISVFRYL